MCDDNEECGTSAAQTMAMLLAPGVASEMDRFLAHIRCVLPEFAREVDDNVLLVVYAAGRTNAAHYMARHDEIVREACDHQTAMFLTAWAEEHGLEVDDLNANLERALREKEGAMQ